jgi:hypothetical protein
MFLYKYLPSERTNVLTDRRIRFTQPAALNDIFEFRPVLGQLTSEESIHARLEDRFKDRVMAELEKLCLLPPETANQVLEKVLQQNGLVADLMVKMQGPLLRELAQPINTKINENIGVLSLSELADHKLMWAHYAERSTGFVVGFDSENPFFQQRRSEVDEFGYLRKVHYEEKRPNVDFANTSSLEWFQVKAKEWEYEQEWRIVRPLSDASQHFEQKPFDIFLFAFPPEAVVEIIAGTHTSAETKDQLRQAAVSLPKARLWQMRESRGYELNKEPVGTG